MAATAPRVVANPPQQELHRKDAPAGLARATKGSFSVRMPIAFNDYTVRVEDGTIGPIVMHVVAGRSSDGFEVGAQEVERTPRMRKPELRGIVAGLARKRGAPEPAVEITREGEDESALAILEAPGERAYLRLVRTPRGVFTLTCTFPNALRGSADRECTDYLRSFEVVRPRPAPDVVFAPLPGRAPGEGPLSGFGRDDLAGRVTVVAFLSSWCLPCRGQKEALGALAKGGRVRLLAVAWRDEPAAAARFLLDFGVPFAAVGLDPSGEAGKAWGVTGAPETYVVDARGNIVDRIVGPIGSYGTSDLAATIERAATP